MGSLWKGLFFAIARACVGESSALPVARVGVVQSPRTGKGQKVKLITAAFSNGHRPLTYTETPARLYCISNQFPFVPGPHLLLCAPRCLFRLSERCDSLHSDVRWPEYFFSWLICPQREPARTADLGPVARLRRRAPKPRFSNPDPALRQTSPREHGMIYSAQLRTGAEICQLVKQRSFMVNRKAVTAFLTYNAIEGGPQRGGNGMMHDHFTKMTFQVVTRHFPLPTWRLKNRREVKGPRLNQMSRVYNLISISGEHFSV